MSVIFRPKIMQKRPFGVPRDRWRIIKRGGMTEVARTWHSDMLPDHFTTEAKRKYRHRDRSKPYRERKKKLAMRGKVQGGGVIDNVFTGRSRDSLINNVGIIRAFENRVTVKMQGPDYLKFNFRASRNQPNKPREITTVTEAERKQLAKVARDVVIEGIKQTRISKTTRP